MSAARSTSLAAALAVLLTAACGERTEPAPSPAADQPPAAGQTPSALAEAAAPAAEAPATEAPPAEPTPQPAAPAPVVTAPPAKAVEEPAQASARPAAFARCQSCHSVDRDDGHGMGPNLAGIMGSKMGSRSGFTYSAAMADSGQTWTPALMDSFLQDPRGTVPGTRMMAAPIRDPDMRQAIIDYLSAN